MKIKPFTITVEKISNGILLGWGVGSKEFDKKFFETKEGIPAFIIKLVSENVVPLEYGKKSKGGNSGKEEE